MLIHDKYVVFTNLWIWHPDFDLKKQLVSAFSFLDSLYIAGAIEGWVRIQNVSPTNKTILNNKDTWAKSCVTSNSHFLNPLNVQVYKTKFNSAENYINLKTVSIYIHKQESSRFIGIRSTMRQHNLFSAILIPLY